MQTEAARWSELAPAKLNLALHVRGRLADGRHALETLFAFCTDGDRVSGVAAADILLEVEGPFAEGLNAGSDNLVLRAAHALRERAAVRMGASLRLRKNLPIASGLGGGSADAAATLRLLTAMWNIDPAYAAAVAPQLGSDVPACLLSVTCRGEGAGDRLQLVDDPTIAGSPVLLVNPRVALSTADVFAGWGGEDQGPLGCDWRQGRNDLEPSARLLVPQIGEVLEWLHHQAGATFIRMSGSGATCFALFDTETACEAAAAACPPQWWHLASQVR